MRRLFITVVTALALIGCSAAAGKDKPAARRIEISVTDEGFVPRTVHAKKDEAVTLVVTRKTDATCATEVVIQPPGQAKATHPLPLNKPVEIPLKVSKAGELEYSCAMGHIRGVVHVE